MYTGPGERVEVTSARDVEHGAPCVAAGMVGFAAKVDQIDRFTRPTDAAATLIEAGTPFVLFITGVHELPLVAPFAAAAVGDLLYIDPADDGVDDVAVAADLPLGVIQSVDASRTPDVARVNLNAWQAFLPVPAP